MKAQADHFVCVGLRVCWIFMAGDSHYAKQWILPEARHIHEFMTVGLYVYDTTHIMTQLTHF